MRAALGLTFVASLLAAGLTIAQNPAQAPPARMDRHFSHTDTDGNGVSTRNEAASYPALLRLFPSIDINSDGKISKQEMQAYLSRPSGMQRAAKPQRQRARHRDKMLSNVSNDHVNADQRKNF